MVIRSWNDAKKISLRTWYLSCKSILPFKVVRQEVGMKINVVGHSESLHSIGGPRSFGCSLSPWKWKMEIITKGKIVLYRHCPSVMLIIKSQVGRLCMLYPKGVYIFHASTLCHSTKLHGYLINDLGRALLWFHNDPWNSLIGFWKTLRLKKLCYKPHAVHILPSC